MNNNNQNVINIIKNFILNSHNENYIYFPLTKNCDYNSLINEFNNCKYIKIKYFNSKDNLDKNIITKVSSNDYVYYNIISYNN